MADLLYAGGAFVQAGAVTANAVAVYDSAAAGGAAWSALGRGVEFNTGAAWGVRALTLYDNELYIAGAFSAVGDGSAASIARWDGTAWAALPSELSEYASVSAMAVYGKRLVVGGDLRSAGGVAHTEYIAQWDAKAEQWSALGTGVNGVNAHVRAFTEYEGVLVVGGFFTSAGGSSARYIATWNGRAWSALPGASLNGYVQALHVHNGVLYAGGGFSLPSPYCNCLGQWTGTGWAAMGSGVNNLVEAFASYNGMLYIAGDFTSADGASNPFIVSWTGTGYVRVGAGLSNRARVATVYDNLLVVGGDFGGGIRTWNGQAWGSLNASVDNTVYALAVGPVARPGWPRWKLAAVIVPVVIVVVVATAIATLIVLWPRLRQRGAGAGASPSRPSGDDDASSSAPLLSEPPANAAAPEGPEAHYGSALH